MKKRLYTILLPLWEEQYGQFGANVNLAPLREGAAARFGPASREFQTVSAFVDLLNKADAVHVVHYERDNDWGQVVCKYQTISRPGSGPVSASFDGLILGQHRIPVTDIAEARFSREFGCVQIFGHPGWLYIQPLFSPANRAATRKWFHQVSRVFRGAV